MINRQKLTGIIASLLLAGVGGGLLVAYVRSAQHNAVKGEDTISVLVVTEAIPKGTKSEALAAKVKTEEVPAKVVAKGAVADLGSVADRVTAIELLAGEQVVESRFAAADVAEQAAVPNGALEVTVALDAVRAMGGQVRDGTSVAVMASFDDPGTTNLIVQKAVVTDVRTEAGVRVTSDVAGAAPTGKLLVTLAVDWPSSERVVFAAEHGRIWLTFVPKGAVQTGAKLLTREELSR